MRLLPRICLGFLGAALLYYWGAILDAVSLDNLNSFSRIAAFVVGDILGITLIVIAIRNIEGKGNTKLTKIIKISEVASVLLAVVLAGFILYGFYALRNGIDWSGLTPGSQWDN